MSASRREFLAWCGSLGAVSADALAVRLGIALASARGSLAAAERAGEMRSWRPCRDVATLYTLSRKGLPGAGGLDLRPARVSAAGAAHAAATCLAASHLGLVFPGHAVLGEPSIRQIERDRGGPLVEVLGAGSSGAGFERGGHRPDLLIVGSADLPVAVEVELTVKAPARLRAICRGWARSRALAGVIYLATDEVLAPLSRAVASAGAHERIVAIRLADLVAAAPGPHARSREPSQAIRSVTPRGGSTND